MSCAASTFCSRVCFCIGFCFWAVLYLLLLPVSSSPFPSASGLPPISVFAYVSLQHLLPCLLLRLLPLLLTRLFLFPSLILRRHQLLGCLISCICVSTPFSYFCSCSYYFCLSFFIFFCLCACFRVYCCVCFSSRIWICVWFWYALCLLLLNFLFLCLLLLLLLLQV